MKRLLIGVLVGLAVGATGASADGIEKFLGWEATRPAPKHPPTRAEVRLLTGQSLGSFMVPGEKFPPVQVGHCSQSMRYCWVKVQGETTVCRALVRLNVQGTVVTAWAPRLRCR